MRTKEMEVATRWFKEVWNERKASTIMELMHPTASGRTHAGEIHGREDWKARIWEPLVSAFSNIVVDVEDMIADGENVVIRWRAAMDHTGEGLLGAPPSGRSVEFTGMTWMVIQDGQIVRGWDSWDATGLLLRCGCTVA